jgi:hypothetical protein
MPSVGRSADPRTATAQARELATNPVWYAETGRIQRLVTREERDLLILHGAADDAAVQTIRSFTNEEKITFSERCRKCRRWIWCREGDRSGTCTCGAAYRVVFDLAPVYHWTMAHGARCMDCGVEQMLHPKDSGISPWHVVNDGQSQCNICHARGRVQ